MVSEISRNVKNIPCHSSEKLTYTKRNFHFLGESKNCCTPDYPAFCFLFLSVLVTLAANNFSITKNFFSTSFSILASRLYVQIVFSSFLDRSLNFPFHTVWILRVEFLQLFTVVSFILMLLEILFPIPPFKSFSSLLEFFFRPDLETIFSHNFQQGLNVHTNNPTDNVFVLSQFVIIITLYNTCHNL